MLLLQLGKVRSVSQSAWRDLTRALDAGRVQTRLRRRILGQWRPRACESEGCSRSRLRDHRNSICSGFFQSRWLTLGNDGLGRAVRKTARGVRRACICHGFDASGDTMAEETAGQIVAWRGEGRVVDVDGGESRVFPDKAWIRLFWDMT